MALYRSTESNQQLNYAKIRIRCRRPAICAGVGRHSGPTSGFTDGCWNGSCFLFCEAKIASISVVEEVQSFRSSCENQTGAIFRGDTANSRYSKEDEGKLFNFDIRRLNNRPPFLDLSTLESTQRFRCLLVAWVNLLAKIGELPTCRRIRQRRYDRRIELADDVLRCAFGHPNSLPRRNVKSGYSRL